MCGRRACTRTRLALPVRQPAGVVERGAAPRPGQPPCSPFRDASLAQESPLSPGNPIPLWVSEPLKPGKPRRSLVPPEFAPIPVPSAVPDGLDIPSNDEGRPSFGVPGAEHAAPVTGTPTGAPAAGRAEARRGSRARRLSQVQGVYQQLSELQDYVEQVAQLHAQNTAAPNLLAVGVPLPPVPPRPADADREPSPASTTPPETPETGADIGAVTITIEVPDGPDAAPAPPPLLGPVAGALAPHVQEQQRQTHDNLAAVHAVLDRAVQRWQHRLPGVRRSPSSTAPAPEAWGSDGATPGAINADAKSGNGSGSLASTPTARSGWRPRRPQGSQTSSPNHSNSASPASTPASSPTVGSPKSLPLARPLNGDPAPNEAPVPTPKPLQDPDLAPAAPSGPAPPPAGPPAPATRPPLAAASAPSPAPPPAPPPAAPPALSLDSIGVPLLDPTMFGLSPAAPQPAPPVGAPDDAAGGAVGAAGGDEAAGGASAARPAAGASPDATAAATSDAPAGPSAAGAGDAADATNAPRAGAGEVAGAGLWAGLGAPRPPDAAPASGEILLRLDTDDEDDVAAAVRPGPGPPAAAGPGGGGPPPQAAPPQICVEDPETPASGPHGSAAAAGSHSSAPLPPPSSLYPTSGNLQQRLIIRRRPSHASEALTEATVHLRARGASVTTFGTATRPSTRATEGLAQGPPSRSPSRSPTWGQRPRAQWAPEAQHPLVRAPSGLVDPPGPQDSASLSALAGGGARDRSLSVVSGTSSAAAHALMPDGRRVSVEEVREVSDLGEVGQQAVGALRAGRGLLGTHLLAKAWKERHGRGVPGRGPCPLAVRRRGCGRDFRRGNGSRFARHFRWFGGWG